MDARRIDEIHIRAPQLDRSDDARARTLAYAIAISITSIVISSMSIKKYLCARAYAHTHTHTHTERERERERERDTHTFRLAHRTCASSHDARLLHRFSLTVLVLFLPFSFSPSPLLLLRCALARYAPSRRQIRKYMRCDASRQIAFRSENVCENANERFFRNLL